MSPNRPFCKKMSARKDVALKRQHLTNVFQDNSNRVVLKTSVAAQLSLFTCALTRTNWTQSQVETCSIVQFIGKLKCAKEDAEIGNDLIFCRREATYNGFYAKITSRPILAGLRFMRPTGSILTLAVSYLNQTSSRADLPVHVCFLTNVRTLRCEFSNDR